MFQKGGLVERVALSRLGIFNYHALLERPPRHHAIRAALAGCALLASTAVTNVIVNRENPYETPDDVVLSKTDQIGNMRDCFTQQRPDDITFRWDQSLYDACIAGQTTAQQEVVFENYDRDTIYGSLSGGILMLASLLALAHTAAPLYRREEKLAASEERVDGSIRRGREAAAKISSSRPRPICMGPPRA